VRYDAAHFASTFPLSPYFGTGFTPSPDHSVAGGIYDSVLTDSAKYTFWYNDSLVLDETQTIEVSARLKVLSSTSTATRAGVALALTSDQNNYTELYLTTAGIFLNGVGRVPIGNFAIDTTAAFHDYLLRVTGTSVDVLVDGISQITGTSFDASTVAAPTLPNWAVLGDITSNAAGQYQMESFSVSVVPEPAGIAVFGIGILVALARKR
jgi:hypothetical protein